MALQPLPQNLPSERPEISDRLIRVLRDSRFETNEAPAMSPALYEEINRTVTALEAWLEPSPPHIVLARVTTLAAHYWTPNMPANLQEAVARDWAEALQDCPGWAVAKACDEWRDEQDTKRPTPAAIRKLAMEKCSIDRQRCDKLKRIERHAKVGSLDGETRRSEADTAHGLEMFAKARAILNGTTESLKA